MKSKTLTAVALASVTLAAAGTADATTSAVSTTKVTIDVDDGTFTGSLSSKKAACESDRKVSLFRVTLKKGKVKTKTKIGSDITNGDGDWTVETGKVGKFRAEVKANSKCGAAVSKIVTVTDDA